MKKELIELILTENVKDAAQRAAWDPSVPGVVVGTVLDVSESSEPFVSFGDGSEHVMARSTVTISRSDIGKNAVLTFERGDLRKPIIVGILQCPKPLNPEVQLDGERLVFTASKEIVLKCGESSITLTRAGKVLIRGAYLSSRSSGVNRIKGGSVQIN